MHPKLIKVSDSVPQEVVQTRISIEVQLCLHHSVSSDQRSQEDSPKEVAEDGDEVSELLGVLVGNDVSEGILYLRVGDYDY